MDLGSYLFCALFWFLIVHSTDMYVVIMQQYKIHIKFTFYFTNVCTYKSININVNALKHKR